MKLSKTFLPFFLLAFFSVFVVSVAFKVYLSWKIPTASLASVNIDLSYSLPLDTTTYKVGQKITVPVYMQGGSADQVSAYDVRINYDSSKLKLENAVPGDYFGKYFTVKWDQNEGWFALAMSPETPRKLASPASPLLVLEFTAIAKADSTVISTGTTTAYVSSTGGFHPQAGSVSLNLK